MGCGEPAVPSGWQHPYMSVNGYWAEVCRVKQRLFACDCDVRLENHILGWCKVLRTRISCDLPCTAFLVGWMIHGRCDALQANVQIP